GLDAFWLQPLQQGPAPAQRRNQTWRRTFIVDQKDLRVEQRELLALLDEINRILAWAQAADPTTTVQFYLWDTLQYEHLTRVIGRHLDAVLRNQTVEHLAWLFPPPELLPNPTLVTRRSPVTIVRDVIRAVLAAPVAHYYSLLQVAPVYHHPS